MYIKDHAIESKHIFYFSWKILASIKVLNFEIRFGKTAAPSGESGSGKTLAPGTDSSFEKHLFQVLLYCV